MANDYRNEARRTPPSDKYGTPGIQQNTANVYVWDIIEEVPIRDEVYLPVARGTPHPVHTSALLVFEWPIKGTNHEKGVRRYYADPRAGQDGFNAVEYDSVAENISYPVFVRSYIELESTYTKRAKGAALTALIGVTVSGGTGFFNSGNGQLGLTFTGGAGSAAAGIVEIVSGVPVAAFLTNAGTGYTSAPTVTVTDILVSGAGIKSVNQIYAKVGTLNGLALYQGRTDTTIYIYSDISGSWHITKQSSPPPAVPVAYYYYDSTQSAAVSPWLAPFDLDADGLVPIPAVYNGNGSGATFTALLQGATCLLVSEKAARAEAPLDSLYLRVSRVYKTLPGPALTGATQNSNGAAGTLVTQDVAYGASADTGADVLESEIVPVNSVEAKKTTRTGATWSNTTGKGLIDGISGTITEAVVDKTAAAIQTGIDIVSSTSEPQDAARNHERTESAPFSTTTITVSDKNARGDDVARVLTYTAPTAALPAESNLVHVKRERDPRNKDRAIQEVETTASNSTLTDKRYEKEAFGAEIDIAEDIITPGSVTTLPALDLTTWDAFVDHTRKNEARKVVSTVIGGLPTLLEYDQDEEYQSLITTSFQFALVSAISAPTAVAGVLTRYEKFDKYRSIKIVRTRANPGGSNGTLAKTRYRKGQHTFPTLLYGKSSALYVDPVTGATKLAWNPTILRARSRPVTFRIQDYFYTTEPAQDAEFNPIGTDYEYNGIMFDVSIPNAICNGGFNLQYSSSGIVETFTFGASPTTLATYLTKVGVWTIITSEVSPWHDGFFLKRNTSLMFQE